MEKNMMLDFTKKVSELYPNSLYILDCIAGAILAKLKLDAQTKEQVEKEAG